MIEVVHVTQHYGMRPILRQVNLRVESGEVVALTGPNGMGKSTLLSVIAGVLCPQKGHVTINGLRRRSSVDTELVIRKKVVYLPDQPWLPSQRTGREFLLAVGRLYEVDDDRLFDHMDRLFTLFDLTALADSAVGSYSTGQRKKLAVCSVLVTEAPIMLLDEPFSGGLDPSGLLALKRILQRLAQRDDVTIVLATPVPELLEEIADRIAVLQGGRIVAYDTIDGLRRLSGCTGTLEEVLERLISPQTTENLKQYFESR